jgi:hypothetical protein
MPRPDLKTLSRSKAWASRLCDHEEEIRELRKRRWSYRAIAAHLRTERGVEISHNGVHAFVKVRARRRLYELPEPVPQSAPITSPVASVTAPTPAQPIAPAAQPLARRGMLPVAQKPQRPNEFCRVVDEGGKVLENMQYGVVRPEEL